MSEGPAARRESTGDRSAPPPRSSAAPRSSGCARPGIDPYPHTFPDRTHVEEILAAHDPAELGEGEHDEFTYRVPGRVTGKRGHGKTAFFDVRDITGTIQAYARRDSLGEEAFARVEDLDIGDLVGVEGAALRDQARPAGDRRARVHRCSPRRCATRPTSSTASPTPRPRYRQRELDLMANERLARDLQEALEVLTVAIRNHMNEHGWVELETPILQRLTGGAAARPFVTHHNALDRDLFLRTATELYLKRAIVGGFEDVYEFGKFFRNEGMSPQHNPEFTMLEMVRRRRRLQRRDGVRRGAGRRASSSR